MAMGAGEGFETDDGLLAEINVTPLVDVMLVLLIVFMVTAPMLVAGIQVELPRGGAAGEIPEEDVVALAIDRDGILFVEDEPLHPRLLEERLRAEMLGGRRIAVRLRADAAVDYGAVVRVLDVAQRAGVVDIGLVTRPNPAGGEDEASRR